MLKLAFLQLRTHVRRTLAVVVAIVLGVAFLSAAMMSGTVISESIRGEVGNQLRGADLIAVSESGAVDPDVASRAETIEGVGATELVLNEYGTVEAGSTSTILRFGPLSTLPALVDQMAIKEGRLPEAANEIALTEGAARSMGVDLDDVVSWTPFSSETTDSTAFRIVGIISGGNAFGTNLTEAFVTPDVFGSLVPDPSVSGVIIQVAPGSEIGRVQKELNAVAPDGVDVLTFDQLVDAEVASMEQGSNALTYGLVAFALIALFVAGIVISNTFAITLTQRTHELAMLRCIGAEKRQILHAVLTEAAGLGVISSMVGVLLGYTIVDVGALALLDGSDGLAISKISRLALIAPVGIGIAVTMLSAIVPARNATGVHPLQALRRTDAPIEAASAGIRRVALTALLIGGGGALLLGGMYLSLAMEDESPIGPLLIGMLGGALSFVGLLLAAIWVVPAGVRSIGALGRLVFGVPATIASSNAARNPRRTASTSSALMMGVTLISMMTVGAATVQATWNDVIDQQAPIDLYIQQSADDPEMPMPAAMLDGFARVDGVRQVVPIRSQGVQLQEDIEVTAVAVNPDEARSVARSREAFRGFAPGIVMVPVDLAQTYGLADGDTVTLTGDVRSVELSVQTAKLLDWEVYIATEDASRLFEEPSVTGAWLRLDDDADVKDVVREISDGIPSGESVSIHGGASDRATYLKLVDQMLMITTGLLGVAVIIALVGVGNTLTLSVLERTRESGMLRAMGLTARQLRGSLAIEGVMIAFTGGLIGLVAGAIYGWIGAITLFGPSWQVTPGFPVTRLLLILAVAVLAGVLASVVPGRRAASVSPVEALATV